MDFAALSHDRQLARLEELARGALEAWDLAGAQVEPVKYRENAVFAVRGPGGLRRVLRVHRPDYRSDAAIRSEAAWMAALSAAADGVPTPQGIPSRAGDLVVVAAAEGVPEPRQCDLLSWVEGRPLGSLEGGVALDATALRRTYRTVGGIAARIHAHGARWRPPPGFVRPAWDAASLVGDDPVFGRFWELEALRGRQRDLLLRARDRARERLEALPRPPEGWGLLHGDLVPDNLLAGAEGIRVIDFDDCGWGWYGFEMATTLFPLATGPGFAPACAGYVEGYRAVRPLPDAHLAAMPDFLMARGLSYLGWPAGRPEMAFARDLVPVLAAALAGFAERYLAGGT